MVIPMEIAKRFDSLLARARLHGKPLAVLYDFLKKFPVSRVTATDGSPSVEKCFPGFVPRRQESTGCLSIRDEERSEKEEKRKKNGGIYEVIIIARIDKRSVF